MRWTSWMLCAAGVLGMLTGLWFVRSGLSLGRAAPAAPADSASNVLVLPAITLRVPNTPPAVSTPPTLGFEPEPEETEAGTEETDPVLTSPWARVPAVRPVPRLGMFTVPPRDPGYYSFRDFLEGHSRTKPPNFPYPPTSIMAFSFFDADFRYLEDPKNEQHDLFDPIKRMHLGDDWLLSLGGEFRFRYASERNARLQATADGPNGVPVKPGTHNDYTLWRTRLFSDVWYQDKFRVYVEYLDAASFGEELAPLPIDVDRSDLLNAFVDLKTAEPFGKPAYLRVGRQELLYGSERLISPLDWANTRRTFQGVKLFRQGEKFDVDLFWVQPVIALPGRFDTIDNDQNFAGSWCTYRPKKGTFVDAYYLFLDNTTPNAPPSPPAMKGTKVPALNVSTFGLRYAGDHDNRYLWDLEGMYQCGDRGSQTISAGAVTTGVGYRFADVQMHPQFWLYYDYASGDQDPGKGGTFEGFNQLFAFGHYYFGFLDLVGRQNIQDFSAQAAFYPVHWITVTSQVHHFELASARAGLFNAAGVLVRTDPTGRAGTDVGEEFDLTVNFHLATHQDLLLGYSKLFPGRFLTETGSGASPDLFYAQYQYRW